MIYSLCGIVVEGALHHHRLNLVLLRSVHTRNVVVDVLRRRIRNRLLNGALRDFPVLLVLIADGNAGNNQAGVLRNQTLLILVLLFRLSI